MLIVAAAVCAALPAVRAQDVTFPADAGIADVKRDFGAKGDGVTDDTAAIQAALDRYPSANKIIYLPAGTYLVSDTLRWPVGNGGGNFAKRTILQGQAEGKTVLRLKDACPSFTDPAQPKAVINTGKAPAQRFRNAIRDLTVDTGKGNPGAIGVQYIANNQGMLRRVTVRSGDGAGVIGLDLGYTNEQGPCLITRVRVEGFDTGVSLRFGVDSVTIEHLALKGQRVSGLTNDGQCLSLRGLVSENAVPAVRNPRGSGVMTLIDATLRGTGKASEGAAVENGAVLFARNVAASGYGELIRNAADPGRGARGGKVDEWVSHPASTLFPGTPPRSLGLPVSETPDVPWGDPSAWTGPHRFGGVGDGKADCTAALQKAIDSGAATVYLPNGNWRIDGEVVLRGKVARLIGCEAKLSGSGTLRVADGDPRVVRLERLDLIYSRVKIAQSTRRTLVLSGITLGDVGMEAMPGAGDLFLEDVCGYPWRFTDQRVWARQLNPEGRETKVTVSGQKAAFWCLGLKAESDGTLVEARDGARAEVLGGFAYANTARAKPPLFVVQNASLSATLGEFVIRNAPFLTLAAETQGVETRTLKKGEVPGRGGGSAIPLYVAAPKSVVVKGER